MRNSLLQNKLRQLAYRPKKMGKGEKTKDVINILSDINKNIDDTLKAIKNQKDDKKDDDKEKE